ncbi:MAG: 30S ribosomal protein S12 methylthiotransferase RimO [Clostridia bacterium]|nr:30S ribosomal protein S12 methylthiotransferase RimO [Clostridia bacterium]
MKVGLISLGCAKNQVASEQMLFLLREAGHTLVTDETSADIIVINTCAFIEAAKQEAIGTILETARLKETGNLKKLIVTGCLAQLYKEQVAEELPEVDAVIGVGSYESICEVIDDVCAGDSPCLIGDNCAAVSETKRVVSTGNVWAYLLIAEGCDNFCSYCLIPSLRGRFRSRPMENILKEAQTLADAGYKELILVAQDLTHYGADLYGKRNLAGLLTELCRIKGIEWIRLHYLYPHELDDELISVVANEPKIVKYLDIPIQHINSGILKKMNRRDSAESIRALFKKLRERIPGLVLRTSLITGLPGEGDAEFKELCGFLLEAKIERAGVFPFSPEEGTPAFAMEYADIDTAIERAEQIQAIQAGIMDEWETSLIGHAFPVLCEFWDESQACFVGRGYFDSPGVDGRVLFVGSCVPGDIVTVKITDAEDGDLKGEQV